MAAAFVFYGGLRIKDFYFFIYFFFSSKWTEMV